MRLITGNTANIHLSSLEDLGAINNIGVIEIKPFRDWAGSPEWQHSIFAFRLCNAGEVLDIAETNASFQKEGGRIQAAKLEILSRAITAIDGRPPISPEELKKYNEDYKTDFDSPREWTAVFLKNLESVVVDRLDAVYGALELKQIRQLRGEYQCAITGKIFPKDLIPEDSYFLKYSLQEIITPEGIETEPNYQTLFDIIEKPQKPNTGATEKLEGTSTTKDENKS